MVKRKDCDTTLTICLHHENNENVETYKSFIRKREKKTGFSKSQTINRIIKEWSEDRCLTLEVTKK